MSTSVERYFDLIDAANGNDARLEELVQLFTDDGVMTPADSAPLQGKKAIRDHLASFYANVSAESKHFYRVTSSSSNTVDTDWAVSARMRQGGVLALQGHNVFDLADDGKIRRLTTTNTPS